MSNLDRFKQLLAQNDFALQTAPEFHLSPGMDAEAELRLHRRAIAEMDNRNFEIVRQFVGRHSALMEELCDLYVTATDWERADIRYLVSVQSKWQEAFRWWGPGKDLLDIAPRRYLQLSLVGLSIVQGYADFRDTLVTLGTVWHEVEERGVDPEPLYRAALNWGGSLLRELRLALDPQHRPSHRLRPR